MILSFFILLLSIILRLKGLEPVALGDEGYTLYVIKNTDFLAVFQDAGNPPFYYLFLKLEYLLFHFNIIGFKLTSVFFGICSIISLWSFLKVKFNLKTANIAAFICAINVIMIYYSQEIRCYSLCMFLSPLLIYFLFQTIQKRKNKYFIIYSILGIVAINTHYYESIFLFLNFIFGLIYLKKRKKHLIKFIISNIIILLSFLPYFIFIAYKGALLDKNFNSWLEDISFTLIKKQVAFIFGGFLSFILSIYFFIKTSLSKKISKKNKLWITYLIYVIIATLAVSILLSFLLRPMIIDRYYCFLIPVFIAFLSIVFNCYVNKKSFIILFIIWLISIQYGTKITNKHLFYRTEQSIFNIIENNDHNYIIIRIITMYYFKTLNGFEKVHVTGFPTKNKAELQKNVQNEIRNILSKDKDAIIYTTLLEYDNNVPLGNYICYYDKKSDLCLWKITNK